MVSERGDESQAVSIRSADSRQVANWLAAGFIDDRTRSSLDQLVQLNAEIQRLTQIRDAGEREMKEIFADQERLRQNLQALGSTSNEKELRERYVRDLARQEDRVNHLRDEIDRTRTRLRQIDEQFSEGVQKVAFEARLEPDPGPTSSAA